MLNLGRARENLPDLKVRMRFGISFCLLSVLVLSLMALATFAILPGANGEPVAFLIAVGTVAIAWICAVPLRRAVRARHRTPLRLTHQGMFFEPVGATAPRFVAWRNLDSVVYVARSARGVSDHHEWYARTRTGEYPRLFVEYPLGFSPRPRRIRRTIRRCSSRTVVSTSVPGLIRW